LNADGATLAESGPDSDHGQPAATPRHPAELGDQIGGQLLLDAGALSLERALEIGRRTLFLLERPQES
jgi:hypothetical protein